MLLTREARVAGRPRADARDPLLRAMLADAGIPAPGPDGAPLLVRCCVTCGSRAHGKPEAPGALEAGWHLSVSYAAGVVVVALTDEGPVGVDVEDVAAVAHADVRPVLLSDDERAARPAWTDRDVARAWTRKEALLKATGHGLAVAPSSVTLGDPDAPGELRRWPADAGPAPSPRWAALDPVVDGLELVGAVVVLSGAAPAAPAG
ncbi:4'-phosphopantetheinyl transferase family protein [Luteimicrobium sp. DT211]|uniref:4'-phosphopantetheinyl transferase family protein n=1 Tax=Luteimicrobium sp. DT211 TaxID=3393412 RepID=UPI003CEF5DB4